MPYAAALGRLVFAGTKTKGSGDVSRRGDWGRNLQTGGSFGCFECQVKLNN